MQSNEYNSAYDDYNDYQQQQQQQQQQEGDNDNGEGLLIIEGQQQQQEQSASGGGILLGGGGMGGDNISPIDFNDPKIASLPRILLMGPRRGGKTSIQVCTVATCDVSWRVCIYIYIYIYMCVYLSDITVEYEN
jgi:hypothetical protein